MASLPSENFKVEEYAFYLIILNVCALSCRQSSSFGRNREVIILKVAYLNVYRASDIK